MLVAGCGGGGGSDTVGDVSGFVQDIDGNPVRDADVYVDFGPQTVSNSAGSYVLTGVHGDVKTIKASTTQNGLTYYGENLVQLFDGERSKSVNITLVRASQRATLNGTVRDRNGFLVEGAHVYAAALNTQGQQLVFNGTMVLTDSNGRFHITTLLGGRDYTIVASARTFNSDTETVNVPAGQSQDLDFTLSNPTDPLLAPPTNVEAIAWTTPGESTTRMAGQRAGLEAIKSLIEPKRAQFKQTRNTSNGNFVEVDLDWTPVVDPSLIGYGIYRGSGNVAANNLSLIDFYRDPLAYLYEDLDPSFQENQTYTYAMSSFNTNAPNTNNSESNLSSLVVVSTLGDMVLSPVTAGPTFHWQALTGANTYQVYVFDTFPSIGIQSIWIGTTSNTSAAYNFDSQGPALVSGHTYYYVVLGKDSTGFSRSLSVIDSFVAP